MGLEISHPAIVAVVIVLADTEPVSPGLCRNRGFIRGIIQAAIVKVEHIRPFKAGFLPAIFFREGFRQCDVKLPEMLGLQRNPVRRRSGADGHRQRKHEQQHRQNYRSFSLHCLLPFYLLQNCRTVVLIFGFEVNSYDISGNRVRSAGRDTGSHIGVGKMRVIHDIGIILPASVLCPHRHGAVCLQLDNTAYRASIGQNKLQRPFAQHRGLSNSD